MPAIERQIRLERGDTYWETHKAEILKKINPAGPVLVNARERRKQIRAQLQAQLQEEEEVFEFEETEETFWSRLFGFLT